MQEFVSSMLISAAQDARTLGREVHAPISDSEWSDAVRLSATLIAEQEARDAERDAKLEGEYTGAIFNEQLRAISTGKKARHMDWSVPGYFTVQPPWRVMTRAEDGRVYYLNTQTGAVTWDVDQALGL